MLSMHEIVKTYEAGDTKVPALKGISLHFRRNEFVSILGPSGCGKTTLLNIIGGLDQYTSGDLVINGISTKNYSDSDWDSYRNHSIGFVFQNYNLIPHQTVLSNVELALTLSGVSKEERRRRAAEALDRVGLGDQLEKKPNQMSGGQMQRVAIARALVNNPDILLADEPTGALDTSTSVQIMDLLKEIAKDKLVVMVTHNPELANQYSTRIINIRDGLITGDSNPFDGQEEVLPQGAPAETGAGEKKAKTGKKAKKPSMSMLTALNLSLKNLLTKKARTILVAIAGSIGIIGIALILSISYGINNYIDKLQEDTLSSYPITLNSEEQDYSSLSTVMQRSSEKNPDQDPNRIYVDNSLAGMLNALGSTKTNDLKSFYAYYRAHQDELADALTDVRVTYDFTMYAYSQDGKTQINPTTIFDHLGADFSSVLGLMSSTAMSRFSVFSEMLDSRSLLSSQYDVLAGAWPEKFDEVVLVVDENNKISNMSLYILGLRDQDDIATYFEQLTKGEYSQSGDVEFTDQISYSYEDFIGMTFYIVPNSDFFAPAGKTYDTKSGTAPLYEDIRNQPGYDQSAFVKANGIPIHISGIVRPNPNATSTSITGTIGYTRDLSNYLYTFYLTRPTLLAQTASPDYDITTGLEFDKGQYDNLSNEEKIEYLEWYLAQEENQDDKADIARAVLLRNMDSLLDDEVKAQMAGMSLQEKANAVVTDLETLLQTNPEAFKTILLQIIQAMAPDQYEQIAAYASQFSAQALYEALKEQGYAFESLDDATQSQLAGLILSKYSEEEINDILALILKYKLRQEYQQTYAAMSQDSLCVLFDTTLYPAMTDEQKAALYDTYLPSRVSPNSYDDVMKQFGRVDTDNPKSISFFPKDFNSKDIVSDFITRYNDQTEESKKVTYTDFIGLLLSSITTIINIISYVLIAFVSISLVVSSIMIGVITYISVLERTKEIGILRAIGASKRDVSRVFNAETLIIGFAAGLIGILATILLCLPVNLIIRLLSGVSAVQAALPFAGAIILVLISMFLTFIAGLIPARLAAKKDPVVALRTE